MFNIGLIILILKDEQGLTKRSTCYKTIFFHHQWKWEMLQRDKEAGYDQDDTGPGLASLTFNAFLSFCFIVNSDLALPSGEINLIPYENKTLLQDDSCSGTAMAVGGGWG